MERYLTTDQTVSAFWGSWVWSRSDAFDAIYVGGAQPSPWELWDKRISVMLDDIWIVNEENLMLKFQYGGDEVTCTPEIYSIELLLS